MDAVNPWLDPSEVRHLAELLLRPVAPARLSAADPGFEPSFVGFMSVDTSPPSAPTVEPEMQAPAPTLQTTHNFQEFTQSPPSESPQPTAQAVPQTRFLERVQIFRDWLAQNFRATEIFILDYEGKVIFDESGHRRLHFMARNLALDSRSSGNIHLKIGPASILEVIPCKTPYGRIVLGALVPEALPSEHIHTITEVLIQTASLE